MALVAEEILQGSNQIKRLDLSLKKIFDADVDKIVSALLKSKGVEKLDFWGNEITDKSAKAIAQLIRDTALKGINLGRNKIACIGVALIAESLRQNNSLLYLDIENNMTGAIGAESLARALKVNTMLRGLNLASTSRGFGKIGDRGAIALASALRVNESLRTLKLHGQNISDKGARAILSALKFNTTLTYISLMNTNISKILQQKIEYQIQRNISIYNSMQTLIKESVSEIRKYSLVLTSLYRGKLEEESPLINLPKEILFHAIGFTGNSLVHKEQDRLKIVVETFEKTLSWFDRHDFPRLSA